MKEHQKNRDIFAGLLACYQDDKDPAHLVKIYEMITAGKISWRAVKRFDEKSEDI